MLYDSSKAIQLSIGDFAPDSDPRSDSIILDADGAVPTMKGLQALNIAQPFIAGSLPEVPNGAAVTIYSNGAYQYWAGGVMHLWRAFGNIWVQADSLGIGSFGATTRWRFAQFNDDLIAVAGGVAPQVENGSTGIFGNLGGSPPVGATNVVVVNGQVLMFQGPNWFCSALATDNNWAPNIQTQAGAGTLYDYPGSVVAAAPIFRNVIVCKGLATWLGSYVGGQAVWSFQLISDQTGAWSQESMVPLPDGVAWLGSDDFYVCQGYTPQRIPNNLKEWFFDVADPMFLQNSQGRYDPYNAVIWWYFVSKGTPTAGVCDRWINYNTRSQHWSTGYTIVPCVPAPNTQPGLVLGFFFDTNNLLNSYTGLPGSMRMLTGYHGEDAFMTQLMGVRPEYNIAPTTASILPFHTPILGTPDIAGAPLIKSGNGWYHGRQTDRYHRVLFTMQGSASAITASTDVGAEISGLSFRFRQGGRR
jgi:hypothetical protein